MNKVKQGDRMYNDMEYVASFDMSCLNVVKLKSAFVKKWMTCVEPGIHGFFSLKKNDCTGVFFTIH